MYIPLCKYYLTIDLGQERLLLSVLPLHLAVEMKNKMLGKLKEEAPSNRKRGAAYSKFHAMYIKVNHNVR